MKIGVLLNRNAGKHRLFRTRLAEDLRRTLEPQDLLRETWRLEQVKDALADFRAAGIDTLAIAGGDGSNHHVLSAAVEVFGADNLPAVMLLCGGTHNAHALSVGIRGRPRALLGRLVEMRQRGQSPAWASRTLLRLSDNRRSWYGFTMATGFMYRFYQELLTGTGDSATQVLRRLLSWSGAFVLGSRRLQETFRLEQERVEVEGTACDFSENNGVACSGMEKLGLGFTPFPLAARTPGRFQAAVVKIRPGAFIKLMGHWWRGRLPRHPDVFVAETSRVVLPGRNARGFVLDGELYQASGRLCIESGPVVRLLLTRSVA